MKKNVTPYTSSESKKKQVTQMFNTIAGQYDNVNRIISLGSDVKWRKKVVRKIIAPHPQTILDVATGTGDLAMQFAHALPKAQVTGIDISQGMLDVAEKKKTQIALNNVSFLNGDSEALPFKNDSFEAISVSFGIRNFENLQKGLSEIFRVLKPQGQFVILETSVPTSFPFKQGYFLYTRLLVPFFGRLFAKDKLAYRYLSKSASVFPHGKALNNILQKIGFTDVRNEPQLWGAATIYSASKK